MFRTTISLYALITLLTPANAAEQEKSEDIVLALPEQHTGNAKDILNVTRRVFNGIGRDDSFLQISSADGSVGVNFIVPDKRSYELQSYIERDFGRHKSALQGTIKQLIASDAVAPDAISSDIPAVLQTIADTRQRTENPLHVMMVVNPVHMDSNDPAMSMRNVNGHLRKPSDSILELSSDISVYGIGERKMPLKNVFVTMCTIGTEDVPRYARDQIGRVWNHLITLKGGTLVTYTDDLKECLTRFEKRLTAVIPVKALVRSVKPTMQLLTQSSSISEEIVDVRDAIAVKTERPTHLPNVSEVSQKDLKKCQADLKRSKLKLQNMDEALGKGDKFAGVTSFTRFQSVPHHSDNNIDVTTGVKYNVDDFPNYQKAWCYFDVQNKSGASVQINVGNKAIGGDVNWRTVSNAILRDVAISRKTFSLARSSCRFPKD